MPKRIFAPLLAAALVAGCTAAPTTAPEASLVAETAPCPPPVAVPSPYELVDSTTIEGPTPATSSTLYRGPGGRKLVLQSGQIGDFFDDSYDAEIAMTDGEPGYLFDRGARSWGFMWTAPVACHQNTIAGKGFDRPEFIQLLRQLGLVPDAES